MLSRLSRIMFYLQLEFYNITDHNCYFDVGICLKYYPASRNNNSIAVEPIF